jgi:hypothetical protein
MSSECAVRFVMLDDHPAQNQRARPSQTLPFFYRKKTGANGESDEISLGPSVVCIFRWIAFIIAAALLLFGGADSSKLLKLLLRVFP